MGARSQRLKEVIRNMRDENWDRQNKHAARWQEYVEFQQGKRTKPLTLEMFEIEFVLKDYLENKHHFFCGCRECWPSLYKDFTAIKRFECPVCKTSFYKKRDCYFNPERPLMIDPVFRDNETFFCDGCEDYINKSPRLRAERRKGNTNKEMLSVLILISKIKNHENSKN